MGLRSHQRRLLAIAAVLLAVGALGLLFWINGDLGTMASRFSFWTADSAVGKGGVAALLATHVIGVFVVLGTHVLDAYSIAAVVSFAAFVIALGRGRRLARISPEGVAILLDLLLPALAVVAILFRHQLAHSPSAIKFLPFVAFAWTALVPALAPAKRRLRAVLGVAYLGVSFWLLFPYSNGFERFFPEPALAWEAEARFLRDNVDPAEIVFSRSTQIGIEPPQRISLSERAVHHAYGPLDIFFQLRDAAGDQRIAGYDASGDLAPLLRGIAMQMRVEREPFSLAHFTRRELLAYLDEQSHGSLLQRQREMLALFPPPEGVFEPYSEPLLAVRPPVSMLLRQVERNSIRERRIHWRDEQNFHLIEGDRGVAVVEGQVYLSEDAMWGKAPDAKRALLAEEIEWARFFLTSLADDREVGGPMRFSWQGYEVVRVELRDVPGWLERLSRLASAWEAYVFVADGKPVAIGLSPTEARRAPRSFPQRALVVFEPLEGEIVVPGYGSPSWSVKKR